MDRMHEGGAKMKLFRFMSEAELMAYLDGERICPIQRWTGSQTGDDKERFVSFLDEKMFREMSEPGYNDYETVFEQSLFGIVSGSILAAFSTTKDFKEEAKLRKVYASYFYDDIQEYHADFYDDDILKLDWYVKLGWFGYGDEETGFPLDMKIFHRKNRKRKEVIKKKRARKSAR